MKKETVEARKLRARAILRRLKKRFPRPTTALAHQDPFQLLIATILSAQCTDQRVNMVTPPLFARFPDAGAFASADQTELENMVRSTGFYRNKAKNIIACSRALIERHEGTIPVDIDALVALPGVGRKTANVVLGHAFGIASGVVVDTHVQRLSRLLGLTRATDPVKIEEDLISTLPRKEWIAASDLLIFHGRATCKARKPDCVSCTLNDLCPSSTV